jgi:hypothetical protein
VAILHVYGNTTPIVGIAANFVLRENVSLAVNIILSESVTELTQLLGKCKDNNLNSDIGSSECISIACKNWTILQSRWTLVLHETKHICRLTLSY